MANGGSNMVMAWKYNGQLAISMANGVMWKCVGYQYIQPGVA